MSVASIIKQDPNAVNNHHGRNAETLDAYVVTALGQHLAADCENKMQMVVIALHFVTTVF